MEIDKERMMMVAGHEESIWALRGIWVIAAASLLVSLWLVSDVGEPGAIYLRAGCMLYLSLTVIMTNEVARSIRVAMGTVLLILAISAVKVDEKNIPLYVGSGLCMVHMALSILTFKGGDLIQISGLRGMLLMSIAALASVIAVTVSVLENETLDTSRAIVFAFTGASTLAMINGVPRKEKDQIVGCFAVLAPGATCMYCLGSLSSAYPWLVAGGCLAAGLAATMVCVSVGSSWQKSVLQMAKFAISSQTMALFLLVVLTFGNIACINGSADVEEARWCRGGDHNATVEALTDLGYTYGEISDYLRLDSKWMQETCIDPAISNAGLKANEEIIPLVLLGLAKGALAVIMLLPLSSDMAETSAWAMSTVLSVSAILLFGIQGRGRCFESSSSDCVVNRSSGFISGLAICGIASLICLLRTMYSGLWVPYQKEREGEALALALSETPKQPRSCRDVCWDGFIARCKMREVGIALATGALLVCLIATSTAEMSVSGAVFGMSSDGTLAGVDAQLSLRLREVYNNTAINIVRCTTASGFNCSHPVVLEENTEVYDRVVQRMSSLSQYWRSTSWIVAGAIAALSVLAVETMPKTPSVGIAIMAGLLLSAGRVHFGCIVASMNLRLAGTGLVIDSVVALNVYIISTIAIVAGLAWGEAVTTLRKRKEMPKERRRTTDTALMLTINRNEKQPFAETFRVLQDAHLLEPFIKARLIMCMVDNSERRPDNCAWNVWGKCELPEGTYIMNRTSEDLQIVAQACADEIGSITEATFPEQRMVLFKSEKKEKETDASDSDA